MRSGLPKPGAIPFLAILIFSLLSLVPSLAKEWDLFDFSLRYISYHRSDGRHASSRVKNGSVDTRSRLQVNGNYCEPWLIQGAREPFPDCTSYPSHSILNLPSKTPIEAASIPDNSPLVQHAVTRGVSAFKAFVSKQWDATRALRISSAGNTPFVDTHSIPPSSTLTNLTVASTLYPRGEGPLSTVSSDLDTTLPRGNGAASSLLQWLPSYFQNLRQRVCLFEGDAFKNFTTQQIIHHFQLLIFTNSLMSTQSSKQSLPESSTVEEQPGATRHAASKLPLNRSSASQPGSPQGPGQTLPANAPPSFPAQTTAGQSQVAGFGPNSGHMRGSSMAIVIGLVVGVMWF